MNSIRSGYVTLVGKPNVGKSTLLNAFLKQKLAITAPKPQTTRHRIMGILSETDYQIIFLDTPGIFQPNYALQSAMVKTAFESIHDADVILAIVEATREEISFDTKLARELNTLNKPVILVINKIDLVEKERILTIITAALDIFPFVECIPISALKKDGLDTLLEHIVSYLPEGQFLYSEDTLTDQSERFFVSELIREVVFRRFRDEVPYSTTVKVIEFKQRKKLYIRAEIYVERDSQKAILIGEKGASLKQVGRSARQEIERFLDEPVFLDLWVKVRKKWRSKHRDVKDLEYTP